MLSTPGISSLSLNTKAVVLGYKLEKGKERMGLFQQPEHVEAGQWTGWGKIGLILSHKDKVDTQGCKGYESSKEEFACREMN